MEGKDDRHKAKRSNMKHHKKSHHRPKPTGIGNGSSSSQVEALRGVIDVADSSDDRFSVRSIPWSPRAIESELEIDMDNEQMRAGDFGMLSQMPTSIGGHFQFSSEKNWDTEETPLDKTEASEYFTLDLNLLNAGLQTIPFYKRLDFPSSWFSKSQLNAMNQAAEIAEKNYQSVLRDHENNPRGKVSSGSRKASSRSAHSSAEANARTNAVGGSNSAANNEKDQELDELLNLTTNEVAKVNIDVPANTENKPPRPPSAKSDVKPAEDEGKENREEIQQWLDDVLEE